MREKRRRAGEGEGQKKEGDREKREEKKRERYDWRLLSNQTTHSDSHVHTAQEQHFSMFLLWACHIVGMYVSSSGNEQTLSEVALNC